jgi:cold shock CspA family protein
MQATVSTFNSDGSAVVLRDDGVLLDVSAEAVTAGGWRMLRPGQRVTLQRSPDGVITAVRMPVL